MSKLMDLFRTYCGSKLDISEHLGLLRGLACLEGVETIVEIGFRTGISATALATSGKKVISYDIEDCSRHAVPLRRIAPNFEFRRADSLKITIPECDLLFIDSKHTYEQLAAELTLHAPRVSALTALHDTETFAEVGKDGSRPGLMRAWTDFLLKNPEWSLCLSLPNNNGLTILKRRVC